MSRKRGVIRIIGTFKVGKEHSLYLFRVSSGLKLDRCAQWELLAGCEAAGPADPNLCLPHVLKEENNRNRVALRSLNTGVHVTDGPNETDCHTEAGSVYG